MCVLHHLETCDIGYQQQSAGLVRALSSDTQYFSQYTPGMQGNEPRVGIEGRGRRCRMHVLVQVKLWTWCMRLIFIKSMDFHLSKALRNRAKACMIRQLYISQWRIVTFDQVTV